jgi:polyhydroxybutyrate depolymerase
MVLINSKTLMAMSFLIWLVCPILYDGNCHGDPSIPTGEQNGVRFSVGGESKGQILVGGQTRTYLCHVPESYRKAQATPLVFCLHGGGGQGQGMDRLTNLNAVADRENFIVAYPDGVENHWNDGRSSVRVKTDDVGFINALIDKFSRDFNIDRARVYATGISNGGLMAERLACELDERLAAVASVASAMPRDLAPLCKPAHSISVLLINGIDDPIVPYAGGEIKNFGGRGYGGAVLSSAETIRSWASRDGCSPNPIVRALPDRGPADGTHVKNFRFQTCREGTAVELYAIEGGGHTWPGGLKYLPDNIVGKTSDQLSATETIWEFFKQHQKR